VFVDADSKNRLWPQRRTASKFSYIVMSFSISTDSESGEANCRRWTLVGSLGAPRSRRREAQELQNHPLRHQRGVLADYRNILDSATTASFLMEARGLLASGLSAQSPRASFASRHCAVILNDIRFLKISKQAQACSTGFKGELLRNFLNFVMSLSILLEHE
jgi:hypothetical protein